MRRLIKRIFQAPVDYPASRSTFEGDVSEHDELVKALGSYRPHGAQEDIDLSRALYRMGERKFTERDVLAYLDDRVGVANWRFCPFARADVDYKIHTRHDYHYQPSIFPRPVPTFVLHLVSQLTAKFPNKLYFLATLHDRPDVDAFLFVMPRSTDRKIGIACFINVLRSE